MNRFLLLLLLVFIYTYHTQATTIPAGNVSGTWTQAGSPYYINGDITVPASATLIIQPGKKVIFNNTYGITVNGVIKCEGTVTDSIFFSSATTTINWKGIIINGSTSVQDSLKIRYCVFSNMQNGVTPNDFNYLALKNCRFYKNVFGFASTQGASSAYCDISDNLFHNNQNTSSFGYTLLSLPSRSKIINNIFRNNVRGCLGILPSVASDTVLIQHNVFDSPSGSGGNAVTLDHLPVYINAKFSDNVFKNNNSSYNYASPGKGAIHLSCKYASFERDSFINNVTATGRGGAIYLDGGGILNINNCYFKGNSAVATGVGTYGDIYAEHYSIISINNTTFDRSPKKSIFIDENSTLSINRCQFTNGSETIINSSSGSIAKVTNTLFANNNGYSILAGNQGELTVGNCTFANNTNSSGSYGKGIYAYTLYKLNIYNSIFWGCPSGTCGYDVYINQVYSSMSSTISVKNCDIQGGLANVYVSGTTIGTATNNINVNPSFANPSPTTGTITGNNYDYSLSTSSALINKGTPDTTGLKLGNLDLPGTFRIMSDTVDIGAYETPLTPSIRQAQTTFTYCEHANTSLSMPVAGANPITYKWLRGTNTLANTSNTLSFTNITAADTGYYSFIVSNTYGSDTVTLHIRISPLPVVSFSMPQPTVCANSPTIALSGGTPTGGTYSGPGVTNTTFNPALAGAGSHQIAYTYNSAGCSNSDTNLFQVNPSPVVSFTVAQSAFCINNPSIALGAGTPAGGVYSGPGVANNSLNPATAGAGNHQIVYTYTNSFGCSNSASKPFQVSALPVVSFATSQNSVCINSPTFAINGGSPLGGNYSGPGVAYNAFNPATAGVGNHQVVYSYTNSAGCSNSNSNTFQVSALPVVSFATSQNTLCTNSPTLVLNGGTPPGGSYSGPGVTNNNFNPATAGAGNYQIVYTYSNSAGCSNSDSKTFQVNASPTVSFTVPQNTFCIGSPSIALGAGVPAGGVYSGPGVTNNSFNPATAGAGNHPIVYTYTNSLGCSNSDSKTVQVSALPVVSFATSQNTLCISSPTLALSGGTPLNGIYSGPGVTNNSFDPATAGAGNHQIVYTYTNSAGCINSASETFQVNLCTGMETLISEDHNISIYPNPNNGSFVIASYDLLRELRIINVLGQEVGYIRDIDSTLYTIGSLNLSAGIYYASIKTERFTFLKRIVVE